MRGRRARAAGEGGRKPGIPVEGALVGGGAAAALGAGATVAMGVGVPAYPGHPCW